MEVGLGLGLGNGKGGDGWRGEIKRIKRLGIR